MLKLFEPLRRPFIRLAGSSKGKIDPIFQQPAKAFYHANCTGRKKSNFIWPTSNFCFDEQRTLSSIENICNSLLTGIAFSDRQKSFSFFGLKPNEKTKQDKRNKTQVWSKIIHFIWKKVQQQEPISSSEFAQIIFFPILLTFVYEKSVNNILFVKRYTLQLFLILCFRTKSAKLMYRKIQ